MIPTQQPVGGDMRPLSLLKIIALGGWPALGQADSLMGSSDSTEFKAMRDLSEYSALRITLSGKDLTPAAHLSCTISLLCRDDRGPTHGEVPRATCRVVCAN